LAAEAAQQADTSGPRGRPDAGLWRGVSWSKSPDRSGFGRYPERPMSASWVAGSVRARALARRRLGAGAARTLATLPSLPEALIALGSTP
jgi:hypothetical protein